MSHNNEIWVIIEHSGGVVKPSSLEAVHAARLLAGKCGGKTKAVVLGSGHSDAVQEAAQSGVDQVLFISDSELNEYTSSRYLKALSDAVSQGSPLAVLLAATNHGKELAGALSTRLGSGLATDCTGLDFSEGNGLSVQRPVYAGKAFSALDISDPFPAVITLRANVFRPEPGLQFDEAPVVQQAVEWSGGDQLLNLKEIVKASGALDITEAKIVVAGGLGMQGPENFPLLEELAAVLGGAVGASRPVVDNGWREYSNQIGQTGRTVSPDLYIACGISGAVQHLAGMSSSKCIVAINRDGNAPIFDVADYGLVGDALEIVPILTREFKSLLAS